MNSLLYLKKKASLFILSLASLFIPGLLSACDTSGFLMDGIVDNGDGTFTIQWTAMVAGGTTTVVGSTWGFYLNIDATILSINPPSFTSANGTTLNAVISGGNVSWGDPNPSGNQPFLNINTEPNDQWFPFTMVVQGIPTEWWGGGQEANLCPGGPGSNLINYEGVFPCFEPEVTPLTNEIHVCPDVPVNLSVIPNHLVETISWSPIGLTGSTVTTSFTQTTYLTITAANAGCETTTTMTVIVDPLPQMTPLDPTLEACPGLPVVLELFTEAVDNISWTPGNSSGPLPFLVVVPPSLPATYTATGSNNCGDISVEFTITGLPLPSLTIANNNPTICQGESITLVASPMNATSVVWQPVGSSGNTLNVSPSSTTNYIAVAFNNCGADTAAATVNVAQNVQNGVTLEACDGESVMYNGIPLAAGSTSTFTFNTFQGCDSVVTVTVNELQPASSQLEFETCEGDSFLYNGQMLAPGSTTDFTFTAVNGCDSVVTVTVEELQAYSVSVQLEACEGASASYNGQSLSAGSTNNFTFQTATGCDSTVTVTVAELPVYASTLTLQTCTGTTVAYNGQQLSPGTTTDFTFTTIGGCDSVVTVTVEELSVFSSALSFNACPGTTVNYNGQALAPATITDFMFTTAAGCDSVVTVTVNEVAAFEESLVFNACTGTTISYNGQTLQPGSVTEFMFTTSQGCDSIVTVTVNEQQTFSSALTLQACTGTTVIYNGQSLSPGSVTDFTLAGSNGCDSTVTVTVEEVGVISDSLQLATCTGTTVSYNGQQLAPGTVADFTFISSQGCDSVVTVTVAELPTFSMPLTLQACTGSAVNYNGINLPPGTVINFTFDASNGCDSVVTVTVEEVEDFAESIELQVCPGATASYNGQNLPPGSVTDFTFISSIGCDSVVTVTVSELPAFTSSLTLEACTGSTVSYYGQSLPPGSVTDFTLTAFNGCDSIVTVTVNELPALTGSLQLQACEGSSIMYNGQSLLPGSVTDFTFTSSQGCDSIVTVTVEEVSVLTSSLQFQACTGSTVSYNGQNLQPGSVTDFTFTSSQGCDSIVTVTVTELFPQTSTLQLSACEGASIVYNGQTLLAGSITNVVLTGFNGCDSTVTVTVAELLGSTGSVTLQGCQGEPLIYQGNEIQPGTSQDFTFTAFNGCDSIVTVTALPPVPVVNTSESVEICEGATAIIFGQEVSTPGEYSQTFTGSNGCDSIHTVTLSISNNIVLDFPGDITIQLGESVVLNPTVFSSTGLTYNWLADPTLSCLDCRNPTATPPVTTNYSLTVSDPNGCEATANQLVVVEFRPGIYIPNAFSPNDDGINDLFMIFSDGKSVRKVNSLLVFSRWGETVFTFFNFQPDDPTIGWDGTYRGKEMDTAVFTWFADLEFIDGTKRLFKGDVTLVR